MKNKGVVLSGLIYALLVFFLLLLASMMFVLQFRQLSINKLKKDSIALYDQEIYTFGFTGTEQTFTVPKTGKYYVQLWGAGSNAGARGGYTSGYINLNKDEKLYLHVGQATINTWNATSYNGSTASGNGIPGGGATDIRVAPIKKYRYVRDYLNGSTINADSHWIEVSVYDRYGNLISLNKTVTASYFSNSLNLVNDGSTSGNYVYPPTIGEHWVEIDLGNEYEISMVKTYHYYSDSRTYYGTKTQVFSADRSTVDTLYDSAVSGNYVESSSGKTLTDLSLRSRIMVAGGAGSWTGSFNTSFGGGLTGGANAVSAAGGNQTTAGTTTYTIAGFGFGGGGCGGGGGYYGGGGADCVNGGTGGSSFISGYIGCDAVNAYGVHTGQPNHYSGYIFTDARTVAGNAAMPSPSGTTELGHQGNGFAMIKFIE